MQRQQLKPLLWVLLALSLPVLVTLALIDESGLKVPSAPLGTISFEFCGYTSSCNLILGEWGVEGQRLQLLSLGLDYLFMVLYTAILCIGLLLVSSRLSPTLKIVTVIFAGLALLAGVADAGENYFLAQVILKQSGVPYGEWASNFAVAKFAIIGLTLSWLIVMSVYSRIQRTHEVSP
ncbi:MAG: hypothetical protein AABY95_04885 [Pseudomonadota bacterium]